MSRNQDRLGVPAEQAEDDTSALQGNNGPGLAFACPTEFVDLPSKGKFYSEGHPLRNKEQVEIKMLSAKEEDILSSKALIKKGIVLDRLLQSILMDKSINVDSLLVGDKNALIIASRITGYGSNYQTKVTCPTCEVNFEHTFDLNEMKVNYGESGFVDENGLLKFTLPKMKVEVQCKLLTGYDEKYLLEVAEKKKQHKLPETLVSDNLRSIIVAVNSNSDKGAINQLIENMPALDSKFLRTAYQKAIPNVDLNFSLVCPECGAESELSMPFQAEFFWPK